MTEQFVETQQITDGTIGHPQPMPDAVEPQSPSGNVVDASEPLFEAHALPLVQGTPDSDTPESSGVLSTVTAVSMSALALATAGFLQKEGKGGSGAVNNNRSRRDGMRRDGGIVRGTRNGNPYQAPGKPGGRYRF